jgi:large subunit ribosomal protein L18
MHRPLRHAQPASSSRPAPTLGGSSSRSGINESAARCAPRRLRAAPSAPAPARPLALTPCFRSLHRAPQVSGVAERPRLAVFRSNAHIYAQVIDDGAARTLASASTLTPAIRAALAASPACGTEAAALVGAKIAELCKAAGVETVSFDRGGFLYHGRVRALAEAAREGGLVF